MRLEVRKNTSSLSHVTINRSVTWILVRVFASSIWSLDYVSVKCNICR